MLSLNIPDDLPSIEEALKLLAAAMAALSKPRLSKVDVQRLRSVVSAVKIYKGLLANCVADRFGREEVFESLLSVNSDSNGKY